MEAARGDEIPYGEPMKIPEHMDSADLFDGPREDDARSFVLEMLDRDPIGVCGGRRSVVEGQQADGPAQGAESVRQRSSKNGRRRPPGHGVKFPKVNPAGTKLWRRTQRSGIR